MSRLSDAKIAEKRESVARRDSDYMDVSDLLADREAILAENAELRHDKRYLEDSLFDARKMIVDLQAELAACRAELKAAKLATTIEDCPDCNGTGIFNREEGFIDGIYYPAIHDATCDWCNGTGRAEA